MARMPAALPSHRAERSRSKSGASARASMSEAFHPGPDLDLPTPRTSRLVQHGEIALGDRVGIERAVRAVGRVRPRGAAHTAVDHEMRDMNAPGAKFSRRALGQAAQAEFADREGG